MDRLEFRPNSLQLKAFQCEGNSEEGKKKQKKKHPAEQLIIDGPVVPVC